MVLSEHSVVLGEIGQNHIAVSKHHSRNSVSRVEKEEKIFTGLASLAY